MLAGDLYLADDPELEAASERSAVLLERFNATSVTEPEERRALLTELLGSYGDGTTILPPFHCDYGEHISVGRRTFVNRGLEALDVVPITIGDDVQIGPGVQLLAADHPLDAELRRTKWESGRAISIGDNVWLGGGVIVLPGVSIGADTVVGAGSVVTKDLPAAVLAVGNPARVVRSL